MNNINYADTLMLADMFGISKAKAITASKEGRFGSYGSKADITSFINWAKEHSARNYSALDVIEKVHGKEARKMAEIIEKRSKTVNGQKVETTQAIKP